MVNTPTPPTPPDPAYVAETQGAANRETAQFQAGINRANQYTPQGSVEWSISGYREDGSPIWNSNQRLSEGEQGVYDLGLQSRRNIGQIGVDQSARIGQLLGTPVDLSNENVSSYMMDLGRQRLDPMFDQRWQRQEQDLANRGISMGSQAFTNARNSFDQSRNDAYNQLLLNGRAQGVQELLTARNQPINEITALLSGSQVSQPNFVGNPQTGVANTDVAGIYNNNFNQQMAGYNSEMQAQNGMMGGMFGLGAAGLRFLPFSDRRLKTDIQRIGQADNGLPIYRYRYMGEGPFVIGFMADEVEKVNPSAVVEHESGYKMVDYERAA